MNEAFAIQTIDGKSTVIAAGAPQAVVSEAIKADVEMGPGVGAIAVLDHRKGTIWTGGGTSGVLAAANKERQGLAEAGTPADPNNARAKANARDVAAKQLADAQSELERHAAAVKQKQEALETANRAATEALEKLAAHELAAAKTTTAAVEAEGKAVEAKRDEAKKAAPKRKKAR